MAADGAANARLLERCGPGGPSEGAGSGGEDHALVKVLDGLRAKKTQRQIAEDIFGADEVAAKWHPDSWMRDRAGDDDVDIAVSDSGDLKVAYRHPAPVSLSRCQSP